MEKIKEEPAVLGNAVTALVISILMAYVTTLDASVMQALIAVVGIVVPMMLNAWFIRSRVTPVAKL